jgi:hypothetical protein
MKREESRRRLERGSAQLEGRCYGAGGWTAALWLWQRQQACNAALQLVTACRRRRRQ